MNRQAVVSPASWQLAPVGGALGVGLGSAAAAWLATHGHARFAFASAVAVPVLTVVLRRRENGLVAGTLLILLVPYWIDLGLPQASAMRVGAALALAGLAALAATEHRGLGKRFSLVDWAVTGIAVGSLVSWLATAHPANSLQATINALVPLGFYVAARTSGAPARWKLIWILAAAGAVNGGALLYELLVAHHPLFVSQDSYLWNASGALIFRPGGILGSPPGSGAVLSMTTLCSLALIGRTAGMRRRLLQLWIAAGAVGVVVTFTRADMIGLAAGGCLYIVLVRPRSLTRLLFVGVVASALIALFVLPRVSGDAWYQSGVLRQGDLAIRQSYWREALPLVANSPTHLLVGHGINSLLIGRPELPGIPDRDLLSHPGLLVRGPHNQFVRTLFEGGVVGLALILVWLGGSVGGALSALRRPRADPLVAALLAALVSFVFASLAGDTMRHPPSLAVAALVTGLLRAVVAE